MLVIRALNFPAVYRVVQFRRVNEWGTPLLSVPTDHQHTYFPVSPDLCPEAGEFFACYNRFLPEITS